MIPLSVQAGLWELLSGSARLIGAAIGWFVAMPHKVIAAIMAFGSDGLISALSFELMDEAWKKGGVVARVRRASRQPVRSRCAPSSRLVHCARFVLSLGRERKPGLEPQRGPGRKRCGVAANRWSMFEAMARPAAHENYVG